MTTIATLSPNDRLLVLTGLGACPAECPADCPNRNASCERDEPDDLDFGFDLGAPLGDAEDPWGDEVVECPKCDGEAFILGTLGKLTWFRCRGCGIDFHVQLTKDAAASASA